MHHLGPYLQCHQQVQVEVLVASHDASSCQVRVTLRSEVDLQVVLVTDG